MNKSTLRSALLVLMGLGATSPAPGAYTTVINSWNASSWNNGYPWGATHNGSAYMLASQVTLGGSSLRLRAQTPSGVSGYQYKSGAVHSSTTIVVNSTHLNWTVDGQFKVPTDPGAWPAFWLNGAWTWPPEIDIMEFKGNGTNWQNTFKSSSVVYSRQEGVPNPTSQYHRYKAWISKANATDVTVDYYIDGVWKKRDTVDYVGKPMHVITNLQTEGSSGTSSGWTDRSIYGGSIEIGYGN
jgi:hypothetical protein